MKNFFTLLFFLIFSSQTIFAQITVTGALAGNGTYTSLTRAGGAFQAINASAQNDADIVITITADALIENGAVSLGQESWKSLTIKPSGVRTISGTASASLININGADRILIDGLNTATDSLTISSTLLSTAAGASTIKFMADAKNITVTNCTILGSGRSTGNNGGTIFFASGSATGNDSITISNCKIGPASPNKHTIAIFAQGSDTQPNNEVTITNCEIYDFTPTTSTAGFGIFGIGGCSDWIISNNKFYHTSPLVWNSGSSIAYGINISNTAVGENIQITGNIFGFSNGNGTGTFTIEGVSFFPIKVYGKNLVTKPFIISSNIISDITMTAAQFTGIEYGFLTAIDTINITANINDNIIRNIILNNGTGSLNGIYTAPGPYDDPKGKMVLNINNNTIENITRTKTGVFYGIEVGFGTDVSISNNKIDNLQTDYLDGSSEICAINADNSPFNINIENNTISNLSSTSVNSISLQGINVGGSKISGNKSIQNNTIRNLSTISYGNVFGIYEGYSVSPASININGNTIQTLSSGGAVTGITHISGSKSASISKNIISDIASSSSNTSTQVIGIDLNASGLATNVFNNVIGDLKAPASKSKNAIVGLKISGKGFNVFHNTIYLNGSSSSVTTFGTACLYLIGTTPLNLRNNILTNLSIPAQENLNTESNGISSCIKRNLVISGAVLNYASSSDNNSFWSNPAAGTNNHLVYYEEFGSVYSNLKNTVADFKTFLIDRDQHSIEQNPVFTSLTGSDSDFLNINTNFASGLESGGAKIDTITDDCKGGIRQGNPGYTGSGSAPDIGAYEFESVSNLPGAAETISGLVSVCAGSSGVVYTVPEISGATSYIWSLPAGVTGISSVNSISVNFDNSAVSGEIKVKGHNNSGDGAESSYEVAVNTIPAAPEITLNEDILLSDAVSGNQWYLNNVIIDNAAENTYSPSQNGDYFVIVTINGCSSKQSNTIAYISSGLATPRSNNDISIYPNPGQGIFTFSTNVLFESDYRIDIYNTSGALVQTIGKVKSESDFEMDLTSFPSGIYTFNIHNSTRDYLIKVFKK